MWLSLVERCVRDAEAVGSNPVISTIPAVSNLRPQVFSILDFVSALWRSAFVSLNHITVNQIVFAGS